MTLRTTILLVNLFFIPAALSAQLGKPGAPPSFSQPSVQGAPPLELMPIIDIASLEAEDLIVDTITDIPWRFGENIFVGLNPGNSGLWETTDEGDRVWRLGIHSPGAYSINLTFDHYHLPPGAELYVYNEDRSFVLGAFTEDNNQEDRYFATSLVPGDQLVIEYFEPAGVPFPGVLNLELVTHAYRSIFDHAKRFGDSGSCNLNVACQEANGWGNEVDAVVLMLVGSNSLCTGALINNTSFDGRPFILSANHCYRNPSTLVFWFNWQSTDCENPTESPPYEALSGAVSRARHSASDFWLLELNQAVPLEYNPYFAGWNRTLDLNIEETVVGIHHPMGDIKKFSYSLDGTYATSYLGGAGSGMSHWRVVWSGGTTTEIGSSGSPLFDYYGRIIGQLHGGYAACNNTEPDWYGRLGMSWVGGNSSSTRLRDWLDPFGSEVLALDGYRPVEADLQAVTGFTASTISGDSIQLLWDHDARGNAVLIAWSTDGIFGEPKGAYSLNDTVVGGGIIMHMGFGQHSYFLPPYPNTQYYFRAWAYNRLSEYSEGVTATAESPIMIMTNLPYMEVFDDDIRTIGWSRPGSSEEPSWQFGQGNNAGTPSAPYMGSENAFFRPAEEVHLGKSAMLVSPPIDFDSYDFGGLTFYYTNPAKDQLQDILQIFYRSNQESEWTMLDRLDVDRPVWTQMTYQLPDISGSYQLGFVAQWNGGHGVCLDAITLSGSYDAPFSAPENLSATVISGHAVELNWMVPDQKDWTPELVGYNIYRDDHFVAYVDGPAHTSYTGSGLGINSYTYFVTAVYDHPPGESDPSNIHLTEIQPETSTFSLSIIVLGEGNTLPDTSHSIKYNQGAVVSLLATPNPNHVFAGWWDSKGLVSSLAKLQLVMDRDYVLEARFVVSRHVVGLSSNPENMGMQQGAGVYNYGQTAFISTTIPFGYTFTGWKEAGVFVSNRLAFSVDVEKERHVTAQFEPLMRITLVADPTHSGIIRGGGLFEKDSEVKINAYPVFGWGFDYWEEEGEPLTPSPEYVFSATQHRELKAVFSLLEYGVSASVLPEGSGIVTGTGTYLLADTASLIATSFENWLFVGWFEMGELISSKDTLRFYVDRDHQLVARFEPKVYHLSVSVEGSGSTEPAPGVYAFEKGEQVLLSAHPSRGWRFRHWIINDDIFINPSVEFTVINTIDALAVFYFPDYTGSMEPIQQSLNVYPNPGSGLFTIDVVGLYGEMLVEVYNTAGQRLAVFSDLVDSKFHNYSTLDLRYLKAGVYIVKVSNNAFAMYERIVIR